MIMIENLSFLKAGYNFEPSEIGASFGTCSIKKI